MARLNFAVILGLFIACFLASTNILYAQIILSGGHFSGFKTNNIDPCTGTTSSPAQTWEANAIGHACVGGALYVGPVAGLNPSLRYMVTPGGCKDEICTGAGGTDGALTQHVWATGGYASNSTHATDLTNGQNNTGVLANLLQTGGNTTPAAAWCSNMNYGGYHDWFLPSKNELNYVLYLNSTQKGGNLGGFQSSKYWSSTQRGAVDAWIQDFSNGAQGSINDTNSDYVRCARIY